MKFSSLGLVWTEEFGAFLVRERKSEGEDGEAGRVIHVPRKLLSQWKVGDRAGLSQPQHLLRYQWLQGGVEGVRAVCEFAPRADRLSRI